MRTINKVILIGNITKDPFIKVTGASADKKIATFTVATNRYYKSPTGESLSEAEYTNCVAWGPLAEQSEKFLVKGKPVYIEGRLKTRIIDKEDGTKLYKTEVVVGQMIFLSKREDFAEAGSALVPEDYDDFADLEDDKF